MLADDFATAFPAANAAAKADADRGAMRSLVWSEKVSVTLQALLNRFQKEGDAMLRDHRIWVCDICGFVWIGDTQPEICPVCKVPHFKITEVERG
jgi:rubrerythrin